MFFKFLNVTVVYIKENSGEEGRAVGDADEVD